MGILVLGLWLWFAISGVKKEKENREIIPTPTVEPTPIEEPSRTGALYISPTKDEALEIEEIRRLKENCPLNNDGFELLFDYGKSKFGVKLKGGYSEGEFYKWLIENGYGNIGEKYFLVEIE